MMPEERDKSFMNPRDHTMMLMRKAAEDEAVLDAILGVETISDEIFGFHCQQAVEKLLKAWLTNQGVHYPKTRNLQALIE